MVEAPSPVHGAARAAYFIGPLLIVLPLVDAMPVLLAPHLGDVRWRFGAAGILSGAVMTPLFGVFLVLAGAAALGHRRPQRIIAWLCLALALVLAAAAVVFTLDGLEVHHIAPYPAQAELALAGAKAMAKISLGALVAAGMGIVVLRGTRAEAVVQELDESQLIGTGGH